MGTGRVNERDKVVELLRWQQAGCRMAASPSPFYEAVLGRLADAATRDAAHPVVALLARAPLTVDAAPQLRLLGGVHRAVLEGAAPDLAPVWGRDVEAAWPLLVAVLRDPPAAVLDALTRDPQTNEVGRAAGLAAGLAEIGRRTSLPLRVFEIGTSAGLNLRLDRYRYEAGAQHAGDPHSPVRFAGRDYEGTPPLSSLTQITERRGCDLHPIDVTTAAGRTRLLSYVWPDQAQRLARLRAALEIAASMPVTIDTASADDWVERWIEPRAGTVTVLQHSIMWQYLPDVVQQRVAGVLRVRGARATSASPIAWLRLEPAPEVVHASVRLTLWPGGRDELLAHSGYHGPPIAWLASQPA